MAGDSSPNLRISDPKNPAFTNNPNPAISTTFQSIKRRDSGSSSVLLNGSHTLGSSTTNLPGQFPRQQKTRDSLERQELNYSTTANDGTAQTMKLKAEFEDANRNILLLEKRIEAAKKLQALEDSLARKRSNTFTSIYSGSTTSVDDSSSFHNVFNSEDTGSTTWKLGDILQSLGDKDRSKEDIIRLSNDLVTLLIDHPEIKNDLVLSAFGSRIQILLTHPVTEVRACGYRVSRYILHDEDTITMLIQLRMELFLVITFSRDNKAILEKEQALKLIRRLLEFPDGSKTLSISVVRAIVAVSESPDDKLRYICIETLCEVSLYACDLVYKSDGLKIILQSFIEGPYTLASICLITVLKLLELPKSRPYIMDPVNISYFVSSFCDIQVKGHNNIERLQNNAFMLTVFLKTWAGLICICQDNFCLLRDLINCLTFDIPNLRDIIMDIFFDVLKIRTLPWIKSGNIFGFSLQQAALEVQPTHQQTKTSITPSTPEKQHPVINQYISLLLLVFLRCNITDKLVMIISESNDDLNKRKAIYLLSEITSLANNLIPNELLDERHDSGGYLPLLTESEYLEGKIPSASVFQMARLSGRLSKGRIPLSLESAIRSQVVEENKKNVAPFTIRYRLDESEFKKLLNDTKILTTKEYDQWNWDLISELMQGPLMNAKRLEESIKTTKLMKRLMSFFRPFKFRFSKIGRKNKNSAKYVKVGCEIFEMLLHTDVGVKFLGENKLLAQIAECIAQVDPYSGIVSPDSLFSRMKLETTMSSGYFKMLGVLSKDPNGLKMLGQWKIFSMFYHITEAKRDDLIKLIIRDMDYKIPSHLRIILTKVLTTSNHELRLFATNHLNNLLYSTDDNFVIELLMDQLFDSNGKVVETAANIIDEYIMTPENLDKVVDLKPNLYQLGKIGHTTFSKFLSTSQGYNYLNDYKIVDREFQEWIDKKNFDYVHDIENLMINDLIQPELYNNLIFRNSKPLQLSQHQHFFGELVKVDEGVKLLQRSGFIEKIAKKIKNYKEYYILDDLAISADELVELKGYLWCVGHICSTNAGIKLFENRDLIKDVITLAERCMNFTVKGTSFLVLGLISKTPEGLEFLDESEWYCKINVNKQLIGICLPRDLDGFFKLNKTNVKAQRRHKFDSYQNLTPFINNELSVLNSNDYILMKKIFENVNNLLSHLLTTKSITNLKNLKFKNADFFNNAKNNLIIFKILTKLLVNYKFSKNLRKFLLNDFVNCLDCLKTLCKKDRQKGK